METNTFVEFYLSVSGFANLSKSPALKNMFLGNSNNLFDLRLVLNICNIMFVICNIGPSRVPNINVILLKNVACKRRNDQFSKFPSKGYKYSGIL